MNKKRIFLAAAFMCMVGLNYSCDKESTSETEENHLSIEKKDIDDEDDT